LDKIIAFFREHNGKRAMFGIALIAAGVVGWYLGKSDTVSTIIIGMGGILLGITSPKLGG
jgi:hypothetical protein